MMHRTSAVIPVYNTPEALLREAVQSVLGQTHGVLELLVIDDGSSIPLTLKEDGNGVVRVIRQPNGHLGRQGTEAFKRLAVSSSLSSIRTICGYQRKLKNKKLALTRIPQRLRVIPVA